LMGDQWTYDKNGQQELATSHMFVYSEKYIKEYAPYTIELGRSFVTPEYQSSKMGAKSLFALDNLWDGLGALTVINPKMKYYFGKMTMYPSYIRFGRDLILYFLKKHFDDKDGLIYPKKPLQLETPEEELEQVFCGRDFKEDYRILNGGIRALGFNIPPLVNAYMNLSPTMKLFGTAINDGFGEVEETGILIAVDEILESKRVRHIESFVKEHPEALNLTSGAAKVIKEIKKS
ncbi:MAG: hemolysin, partial [Prevotella sp.]|nr:hemolysin [Prevotella sp.]